VFYLTRAQTLPEELLPPSRLMQTPYPDPGFDTESLLICVRHRSSPDQTMGFGTRCHPEYPIVGKTPVCDDVMQICVDNLDYSN